MCVDRSRRCSPIGVDRGRAHANAVHCNGSERPGSVKRSRARWFSTATTVARTRARVCAEDTSSPPVRSIAPINVPVTGSCTGTAVQLHGCTRREKCSVPRICTSASSARAVPGALVPAPRSLQSAPGTKFIASARRHAAASPSTQSKVPSAALIATMTPLDRASSTSSRRMTGSAEAKGCSARMRATPSAERWAAPRSGSTPRARLRCQLSTTTRRRGVVSR